MRVTARVYPTPVYGLDHIEMSPDSKPSWKMIVLLTRSKFAVQLASAMMVPAQSGLPVQPVNTESGLACVVNITLVTPG